MPVNSPVLPAVEPYPFAETVENVELVGSRMVDHIVGHWDQWKDGVPALPSP